MATQPMPLTYVLELDNATRAEILDALNQKDTNLLRDRERVQRAYRLVHSAPEKPEAVEQG
jgi:capsular polysaccharide biosynthesis protein